MPNNTEQIKKRRNSILKKPPTNDDDTTGDVTTKIKRRISFSGKKSVKEFIAGDEEATIWGTSYEESAECLQANSAESGLVNVHEKRIILRNRRVVVEPSSGTKRRSKKKVHIAENDKENIFIQPPEICLPVEAESVPKTESLTKSELTLPRSQPEDLKIQPTPGTQDGLNVWSSTFDFINCTAAINKTITIENSVDVSLNEDELQMLKFRVPVTATDVSPNLMNLSLDSLRDGPSPNIFSRSILMSEEDVKMLKKMRGTKDVKSLTETQVAEVIANLSNPQHDMDMDITSTGTNNPQSVADARGSQRKTLIQVVDMEADKTQSDKNHTLKGGYMNLVRGTEKKRTTIHSSQSMDVTQCGAADGKSLKRKTITKAVSMEETGFQVDCTAKFHSHAMDISAMDVNSPMRKKPMHDATSNPMDIINDQNTSQEEQTRRQTIHFESAAIKESVVYEAAKPGSLRQTMHFEEDPINEESAYPSEVTSHPDVVEDDRMSCNISMELSVCDPPEPANSQFPPTLHFDEQGQMSSTSATYRGRQSIHTPDAMIEDSPKSENCPHVLHHESTTTYDIKSTKSTASRQTIYDSADIMEESIALPDAKQRQSTYTPSDILADSPNPMKPIQTPSASKISLKNRQSVYTPADIVEDSPAKSTKLRESNAQSEATSDKMFEEHPVVLTFSNARARLRESIYTPADMIEDSPKSSTRVCETTKMNAPQRQTTHASTDIAEDLQGNPRSLVSALGSHAKQREPAPVPLKFSRESIYTPADMIEDSPKSTRTCETTKTNPPQRRTTHASTDVTEDLQGNPRSLVSALESYAKQRESAPVPLKFSRESIYTAADMIEDSPKSTRTCETTKTNAPQRQTTHASTDVAEDLSGNQRSLVSALGSYAKQRESAPVPLKFSRESIYTPADMIEDSPKSTRACETTKTNAPQRQTTHASTDVAEDLPGNPRSLVSALESCAKQRQSTYITSDMNEDAVSALKCVAKQRQSVYTPADMIEDSPKVWQSSVPVHKSTLKYRQSVYTPTDMIEDSPKTARPSNAAPKDSTESGQSTYDSSNLNVESPEAPKWSVAHVKGPTLPTVIGKHSNLQQTLSDKKASLKSFENQQTTGKPPADDSCMDMSILEEQPNQFKENDNQQMRLFNETKRNTAENALTASRSNRRTVHFQENNDLEESVQPGRDDSTMNLSITTNQEHQPTLPLPRRPTIFDACPVDIEESPQKITIRKSSFSRTLNFNAIPTSTSKCQTQTADDMDMSMQDQAPTKVAHHTKLVNDDSPLYYYNPKSKHNETTAEIDRSLAEYLKAEVAATLFPTDTSMNISETEEKSVYFDAEEEQQSKPRRQTSFEPANISEESGMEPLQEKQSLIDSIAEQSEIEKCENSMELDMPPEKPFESKDTTNRKTIHFTNENAVDESFFDEKHSKPQNRHTIYFNTQHPVSEMDVTLSVKKAKSTGIQSLKEILQESTMLFTQSKLVKPSAFDNKRSTIFFACKDNSMDMSTANQNMECESPETNADPECTPTKSSKSRIPQLIGSAKKLQSMKKSMEFIQQELPNLSYPVHRDGSPEESLNNTETRPHEPYSPDIPRRATTFKSKLFEESFDAAENSRRTTTNQQEQFSDTIEIPRRATAFQRNDTLYLSQNEVDVTNMSQKSLYKFEDAPITISDVSTFFAQKPSPPRDDKNETYSPNTTETSCHLAKEDHMPKSSDSDDTTHNFDKFKKRYVELTCDSIVLSDMMEDIEKTHLSLVNTLDEQSEVVHSVCPQQSEAEPEKVEPPSEPLKPISSVCRKCKRHRLSTTQNETTIGSFMVEPIPEYQMDLAALSELATKPKISDIAKVWQQKMRESDSFNISDASRSIALDDQESVDDFIAALNNERLIAAQQRQRKDIKRETSFVSRVREQMQSKKSNWILNELLLAGGVLKFTHTRIRTFAIVISFTPKDPRGIEVNFNEIHLVPNVLHSRQWTPFDYALHYQLLVELPFDLRKLCPTSENLFELLEHVENVTQDVLKTGKDMLYLVLTSPASLIRESSGSLYIRKYARTRTPQNEVKRTEFQIEVRNIKNLSYESIAVPPLYEFDEKIQLLPVGQDFLRIFLADPMRYMKT